MAYNPTGIHWGAGGGLFGGRTSPKGRMRFQKAGARSNIGLLQLSIAMSARHVRLK
jgi:hypothetical protein